MKDHLAFWDEKEPEDVTKLSNEELVRQLTEEAFGSGAATEREKELIAEILRRMVG